MSRLKQTHDQADRRQTRTRARLSQLNARPRLVVSISNRHVLAQIVDDAKQNTLATINSRDMPSDKPSTMTEKSAWVGGEIAKRAKTLKIKQVVFDRGAKRYHGRIKVLAESARQQGLEF